MTPVDFEYYSPQTLDEAFVLLGKYGIEAKVLAGGVDIVRNMKYRVSAEKHLISLKNIKNLDSIEHGKDGLRIGAMTKLSSLVESETIKTKYVLLHQVVKGIGTPQLRNLITVGGNLCQEQKCWHYNLRGITPFMRQAMPPCWRRDRSFPCYSASEDDVDHSVIKIGQTCWTPSASDLSVALSCLSGVIKIMGENGERQVPVEEFYTVNGDCLLKGGEIVTEILIPNMPENASTAYIMDKRSTMDFPVLSVATLVKLDHEEKTCSYVKTVLGGAAPKPISATKTYDNIDVDKAREEITGELVKNERVMGPATDFKVNEARIFIKDAFELIRSRGENV